jgi:hypothetical protein
MLIEVICGKSVAFGEPEQKLFMQYYGIFVGSAFIGVGLISKRTPSPNWTPKMA